MSTSERIYFTSPDPDYIFEEGARVAPNDGDFPTDATVHVETDTHFLEFGIEPKNEEETEFVIALVDSLPPLPNSDHDIVIVEGDVLKKNQEFTLISTGSNMAAQSFRAMRILSNVEQIVIYPRNDEKAS